MKTPRSGQEISKKWLEYILREHKAATDSSTLLQVDNFTVRKGREREGRGKGGD